MYGHRPGSRDQDQKSIQRATFRKTGKFFGLILKIKDLSKADIENKGLIMLAWGAGLVEKFKNFWMLILKTNDLANADIENKEVTKFDIENTGFSSIGYRQEAIETMLATQFSKEIKKAQHSRAFTLCLP